MIIMTGDYKYVADQISVPLQGPLRLDRRNFKTPTLPKHFTQWILYKSKIKLELELNKWLSISRYEDPSLVLLRGDLFKCEVGRMS